MAEARVTVVRYATTLRLELTWIFSIAGFVWLLLLFVLILADYETRLPVVGWSG